MEGLPTFERGIEDEIRRSAFNGCRRILNKTSPEDLRALLAAVRQLEATSVVSRRRARETSNNNTNSDSAAPPSTSPILFVDQCEELALVPSNHLSGTASSSVEPVESKESLAVVEEDAGEAIGTYLRVWLDTVIGLSLEALTSWALHAFCILLGLLPVASAATPKKSKTVLYSILSNFHYEN